jgi:DNA-directed RNA polymerase I, II, and III subunit RPABC1
MDVLKLMLKQRGMNVELTQAIVEPTYQGEIVKIDKAVVYTSGRARIGEKDISKIIAMTEKNGGSLSIVIVPIPPSSTILATVRQESKRIQIFHTGQLQFDIFTHRKVPPHRILNEEERKKLQETYHIEFPATQMPLIDSQDAAAKWVGAVPGDILEILRKSDTAGTTPYYRYCVADTSL